MSSSIGSKAPRTQQEESAAITEEELDALLSQLTEEELQAISEEVDPDDSYLPASERVRNQTDKAATGPFDRLHLVSFLEEQAKQEKDWEEAKPYVKETRGELASGGRGFDVHGVGNVWKPPPQDEEKADEEVAVGGGAEFDLTTAEWDDVLKKASAGEIAELAAILGLTGLVNQKEYYSAQKGDSTAFTEGWSAATKAEELQYFPPEPDNDTNIEDVLAKLKAENEQLSSINLNNIKDLPQEKLQEMLELMKTNSTVLSLHLCNLALPDSIGTLICDLLKTNKTLVTLNVESNRFTSSMIVRIIESSIHQQTVKDIRLANQRAQVLGNRCEMEIADLIEQNKSLLRLGIQFHCIGPRAKASEFLKRNMDSIRKERLEAVAAGEKND